MKILILTGDFADDYELMVPYSTLITMGCEVDVICPGKIKNEFIKTSIHYVDEEDWKKALEGKPVTYSERLGHPFRIPNSFNWDNPNENLKSYNGLIIPGGRAPEYISLLPEVQKIVTHFIKSNKIIGAICHGIQVITYADSSLKEIEFLKGKKVFPYPSLNLECELLGAEVVNDLPIFKSIVHDDLVTAPTWQALPDFMKKYLKLLELTSILD